MTKANFKFPTALATSCLLALTAFSAVAAPSHGVSVYGPQDLKLGPKDPFPYVNPDAPKGGHLNLRSGNFTTLNSYTLKGLAAPLLDLIFESPMARSNADNEPGTAYGHLVETIDIADDHLSLVYKIRPQARFSDGKPVTADDFVFSYGLLAHPEFHPFYKQYFADIKQAVKIDPLTVRVEFNRRNQELPLITGEMPIFPKHVYGAEGKDFGKDFDTVAVGSGPYVIDSYEFGKYIRVRRHPQWWARDLPRSQGLHNFDTVTAKVFLDDVAMREALKGGDFDVLWVSSSKDWALDFKGPFIQKNYILRQEIHHQRPVGMQCFAFNLRRPLFQSHKTRYAIALMFDFPWSNTNLFYGQYTRARCYFDNSPDLTNVQPPGPDLKNYLLDLRQRYGALAVPKAALTKPLSSPGAGQSNQENLRQAEILLDSLGWERAEDGIRTRASQRLSFELLLVSPTWQRIAEPYVQSLKELGVEMRVTVAQPADYQKRLRNFDFDMIVNTFGHSPSPGNEMIGYWGSEAADTEGSQNVLGLKNPAVDEILAKAVAADSRQALRFQIQALDRILTCATYVVPQWSLTYDRVLAWNKFGRPDKHCSQLFFETCVRDTWWHAPEKADKLKTAMEAGVSLPKPE